MSGLRAKARQVDHLSLIKVAINIKRLFLKTRLLLLYFSQAKSNSELIVLTLKIIHPQRVECVDIDM